MIKTLYVDKATYIFGIATYGGFPADTLKQLKGLLKVKGLKLSSGFGLHMPGNYTPFYSFSDIKFHKVAQGFSPAKMQG